MLSGESTPLLKESIELREGTDRLDMNGADRNNVLFSGTKALQVEKAGEGGITSKSWISIRHNATQTKKHFCLAPDGGCLAVVLRTGFGTTQGQLVRTMIFSTERVSANTFEAFLFIGFLLIFAIAASAYVWIKGLERGMAKGKLLLDCVLIITSVVPPELPMELSLAVNASLVALQKFGKCDFSAKFIPLTLLNSKHSDLLYRAFPYPMGWTCGCLLFRQDRYHYW